MRPAISLNTRRLRVVTSTGETMAMPKNGFVLQGFYQPHKPVRFDGLLLNHVTGEYFKPVVRTKQDFKAQCDINNIIKSFTATGQINHVSAKAAQGAFMDLPDDLDFQSALNIVIAGENAFMALPAKLRDRFHNDPVEFLEFVTNPANADELVKLGIRNAPPPAAPSSPEANPAPAPAPAPGGSQNAT